MTRGVRLYLVGSLVLVSLAGCGRGFFQSAEREPWRAEAEIACLKSGAVKENAELVRISPISGPGVCGAEYPLKVAALGESSASVGFADDPRPPGTVGNQPRWPVSRPPAPAQAPYYPDPQSRQPGYGASSNASISSAPISNAPISNAPISLAAPGVSPEEDHIDLPPDSAPGSSEPAAQGAYRAPYPGPRTYPPRDRYPAPTSARPNVAPGLPRLGPAQGNSVAAFGPVAVKPAATLACPIVSALDRWLADSVQPAAQRWFGARVVEIKQISAYSCRGMNGNSRAHISEHAVQAAACQQFSTVLAPGSNVYHYDHIHVDLMRRASQRVICEPAALSGEEVAARAGQRTPYASRAPFVTGSFGGSKAAPSRHAFRGKVNEEDEFEDD